MFIDWLIGLFTDYYSWFIVRETELMYVCVCAVWADIV